MARTGARAAALNTVMIAAGYCPADRKPEPPRLASLDANVANQLRELHRTLGGTAADPQLRPGSWDLAYDGDLVVELDEELHFNRYRLATLATDCAAALPWHDDYVRLCADREPDCLKAAMWGKRWTNPSCELMFGVADAPGEFGKVGSPRWKQRAMYDALKDGWAASQPGRHLARISVHDTVGGVNVESALRGRAEIEPAALAAFITSRTTR
jgi:hypothetical protein